MALTTTAQANQELIEKAYAAFAQGDIPTVMRVFDDKIVWHVPGRGPLSRDYHGHESGFQVRPSAAPVRSVLALRLQRSRSRDGHRLARVFDKLGLAFEHANRHGVVLHRSRPIGEGTKRSRAGSFVVVASRFVNVQVQDVQRDQPEEHTATIESNAAKHGAILSPNTRPGS